MPRWCWRCSKATDALDTYSDFVAGPAHLPATARIGVPKAPAFFGDAGYAPMFAAAIERARGLGQQVVELDFAPLFEVAALLYEGPWVAERHSVVRELLATQPEAFDPAVRQVIGRAPRLQRHRHLRGAVPAARTCSASCSRCGSRSTLLMVPTAPGHPRFDEVDADPLGVNARLGTYTNFVNLLGWCALALPAGHDRGEACPSA